MLSLFTSYPNVANIKLVNNIEINVSTLILLTKTKLEHSKRVFGLDKRHRFILTENDITNGLEKMRNNLLNKKDEQDNNYQSLYI